MHFGIGKVGLVTAAVAAASIALSGSASAGPSDVRAYFTDLGDHQLGLEFKSTGTGATSCGVQLKDQGGRSYYNISYSVLPGDNNFTIDMNRVPLPGPYPKQIAIVYNCGFEVSYSFAIA
jgi:hypothetical protein